MNQHDAEVIIIGAGPAGSIAAFELSRNGIPVLILEKSFFPRYKVCGSGLTYKVLSYISFDVSPIIETTIYKVRFSNHFQDVFTRISGDPMMVCTMRERLDDFLLSKAIESGARVMHGVKVTDIRSTTAGIEVETQDGICRSRLVIGADGASGITSLKTGMKKNMEPGLAWEAELRVDSAFLEQYSDTVFLDWGTFPGGYAWLFPKKDHVSVGVGGPARLSTKMLPYYDAFTGSLEPVMPVRETISMKAWPIPVTTRHADFHSGRILLTGDAGGLTDPLTGEGIYYAVRSGRMAAEACKSYLNGNNNALRHFSEEVNDILMDELLAAVKIRYIFNAIPVRVHHWVRDNERVWRAFAKVLRGDRNYGDVRRFFGKRNILWPIATTLSSFISWIREKRFKRIK